MALCLFKARWVWMFCLGELDHSSIVPCKKEPHAWDVSSSELHLLPSQCRMMQVLSLIPDWGVRDLSPQRKQFQDMSEPEKRGEGQDWGSFWFLGAFPVLLIQPRLKVSNYWDPHLPMYPPVPRAAGPSSPLSLSLKGQGSWENPAKWELKMTKQLIRSEVTRMRNKSH